MSETLFFGEANGNRLFEADTGFQDVDLPIPPAAGRRRRAGVRGAARRGLGLGRPGLEESIRRRLACFRPFRQSVGDEPGGRPRDTSGDPRPHRGPEGAGDRQGGAAKGKGNTGLGGQELVLLLPLSLDMQGTFKDSLAQSAESSIIGTL